MKTNTSDLTANGGVGWEAAAAGGGKEKGERRNGEEGKRKGANGGPIVAIFQTKSKRIFRAKYASRAFLPRRPTSIFHHVPGILT